MQVVRLADFRFDARLEATEAVAAVASFRSVPCVHQGLKFGV